MAILGGSPLGLVGVKSRPDNNGKSSLPWNGKSISVDRYNNSKTTWREYTDNPGSGDQPASKTEGAKNRSSISIFSRRNQASTFTPWPGLSTKWGDLSPDVNKEGIKPSPLHSDDLYDTSILNILKKLEGTNAELRASHFAYLKNVGVFPNNRLMIARRFESGMKSGSNLFGKGSPAMAVMISWVKQEENFIELTFGEEWTEAEADFQAILNEFGEDFTKGSKLGNKLGTDSDQGGLGIVPLPGFSETLQRFVWSKMGIFNPGAEQYIPQGEPNLIKTAKRRKLLPASEPGSGLRCSFSIKMECEWEQKFISGLDPTIAWLDIINEILRFGTSVSKTFGLSSGVQDKVMGYVNNPEKLIQDIVKNITEAVTKMRESFQNIVDEFKGTLGPNEEKEPTDEEKKAAEANAEEKKNSVQKAFDTMFENLETAGEALIRNILGKYKERILGVFSSLTGNPSGPWHISIGNPMRPIFSSGDMLAGDITLTLGPTLAYNDLPSSIKASFTMTPARPLGLQEIFARFNSGHLRAVVPYPSESEKLAVAGALQIKVEDGSAADGEKTGPSAGPQKESTAATTPADVKSTTPLDNKNNNSNVTNASNAGSNLSTTSTNAVPPSGQLTAGVSNNTSSQISQANALLNGGNDAIQLSSDANGPIDATKYVSLAKDS